MIELKNVTKAYGNKTIFSKLSFKIDTGEFVVFSDKCPHQLWKVLYFS